MPTLSISDAGSDRSVLVLRPLPFGDHDSRALRRDERNAARGQQKDRSVQRLREMVQTRGEKEEMVTVSRRNIVRFQAAGISSSPPTKDSDTLSITVGPHD